jgi:hypothetical protein
MKNVKIIKDPINPESAELLAKSIVQVAAASKKLLESGISLEAIVVLLHARIGTEVGKPQIRMVLDALPRLKAWYIK